ncbi:TetR family transcriptional regulator [Enterobacter sp. A11]|uniref:acrylate utilization transcriptional regulator AcuR n=1 Tax=unclassified Enterobacter TaxID=2608935 RepID=UPI00106F43FA|nr:MULTISPECIES: TetR/AcrR family transcriptional regulator [unclassified Enterobacter]MBM1022863.1 TetR/AcrR family transcriptional regulator [Enterobacter sp. E1]MEA3564182.1 TetR family transcriptional regulator C-terminal domain-containing protein [Enterobacter sp. GM-22]MEA3597857.1 TetR family transcriptional regulator C-terminal domain-containing protein [Enterobacter sp. GM-31]TFF55947.1 TetR family transcriptional regulator [Enterobacter sp. A11]
MIGETRGRGRPRKTESTYADTRNDLIRSGLELLTQNGFLSTGVDAIVKNASVPKGSFYYYFKSKEEYAQTVLSAYDSFFEHKLKKHLHASSCAPMIRLENFIHDACDGIKKYNFTRGCLVGNMMQESPGLPPSFIKQLQDILESWQALVATCLSDALSSGEICSDMNDKQLAAIFWSGWEGAVMRAKLYCSTQPVYDFWSYFKTSVRYQPSQDVAPEQ